MATQNGKKTITISMRSLVIALLIFLFLIGIGVTVAVNYDAWFGAADPTAPSGSFTPDIDENAGEYTGEQPKDEGGEAVGIKIPGYPSITVPANQQDITVALLNPEGNPCYFVFNLVLKDTGETLYTSKMVPPGQSINQITLAQALPVGEYAATLQISTYSLTDGSAMNGANVETVLIAK